MGNALKVKISLIIIYIEDALLIFMEPTHRTVQLNCKIIKSRQLMIHLGELVPDRQYQIDFGVLCTWFLVMFTLMTATFGVGAPTGLFIPALAVGGCYGAVWGRVIDNTITAMGFNTIVQINLHAYPVLGMAAILAGATRMTMAIVVLCIETTCAPPSPTSHAALSPRPARARCPAH